MDVIEKNELISIVVPIYNTEKYLDECIKSIVGQTYSNLEILLIVDGSPDNSFELCNIWKKRDGRIKVFNNKNHGVSYTRNFGIDNSTGEYIAFIDSDDVVADSYIETLYKCLLNNNSDMATVSYNSFKDGVNPLYIKENGINTYRNNLYDLLFENNNGFVWCKIYKLRIIKEAKLKFNTQISICEDLLFNFNYIQYTRTVTSSFSKLYGYRQRNNSAVHNTTSLRWFSCLDAYRMILEQYGDTSVSSEIVFQYLKNLYEAKYHIKHQKIESIEIREKVFPEIKRIEKLIGNIQIKKRVKLLICKYMFFAIIAKRRRDERKYV